MSKTRPFSIYLLKTDYDASNALNDEHGLGETEAGSLAGPSIFPSELPKFGVTGQILCVADKSVSTEPDEARLMPA
jgi:hypothetical protein